MGTRLEGSLSRLCERQKDRIKELEDRQKSLMQMISKLAFEAAWFKRALAWEKAKRDN